MSEFNVAILACTGLSNGEFIIALEWLNRLSDKAGASAIVPAPLATTAAPFQLPCLTYPSDQGPEAALDAIRRHIEQLHPTVLVIADLLLFAGFSPEFGSSLLPLLEQIKGRCQVVAFDLYDWEKRGKSVDVCGQLRSSPPAVVPADIGRLHPAPYLPPAKSSSGHGHYMMLERDHPDPARRRTARRDLAIGREKLVVITTSTWQHAGAYPELLAVTRHFPDLVLTLVDLAAQRVGTTLVMHLGPQAFDIATPMKSRYIHRQPEPELYARILAAADLFLSVNCISSSSIRAASMAIPVAAMHLGPCANLATGHFGATPASRRLADYSCRVAADGYPISIWPVGMYGFVHSLLQDNPFAAAARHIDMAQPDAAVDTLASLLAHPDTRRTLIANQTHYFESLERDLDSPQRAFEHALAL